MREGGEGERHLTCRLAAILSIVFDVFPGWDKGYTNLGDDALNVSLCCLFLYCRSNIPCFSFKSFQDLDKDSTGQISLPTEITPPKSFWSDSEQISDWYYSFGNYSCDNFSTFTILVLPKNSGGCYPAIYNLIDNLDCFYINIGLLSNNKIVKEALSSYI